MATPQPEPNEQLPTGVPPAGSFADRTQAGNSPDAVWLTVCGWCARVRVGERWLEVGHALTLLELTPGDEPSLTHGICPSCFSHALQESARARREAA